MTFTHIVLIILITFSTAAIDAVRINIASKSRGSNDADNSRLYSAIQQDNVVLAKALLFAAANYRSQSAAVNSITLKPVLDDDDAHQGGRRIATDHLTPLHLAARFDSWRVATFLVDNGANLTATSPFTGRTPLLEAAQFGSERTLMLIVDKTLRRMSTDDVTDSSSIIMSRDAVAGRNIFHTLLTSTPRKLGRNASSSSVDESKIRLDLLRKVADSVVVANVLAHLINTADDLGDTPLHLAVNQGNLAAARLLLNYGADCQQWNADGRSPLHLAAHLRQLDLVRGLLQSQQCDPDQPDQCGRTLFEYPVISQLSQIARNSIEAFTNRLSLIVRVQKNNNPDKMAKMRICDPTLYDRQRQKLQDQSDELKLLRQQVAEAKEKVDEAERHRVTDNVEFTRQIEDQLAVIQELHQRLLLQSTNKPDEDDNANKDEVGEKISSGDDGQSHDLGESADDVNSEFIVVNNRSEAPATQAPVLVKAKLHRRAAGITTKKGSSASIITTSTTPMPTIETTSPYVEYVSVGIQLFNDSAGVPASSGDGLESQPDELISSSSSSNSEISEDSRLTPASAVDKIAPTGCNENNLTHCANNNKINGQQPPPPPPPPLPRPVSTESAQLNLAQPAPSPLNAMNRMLLKQVQNLTRLLEAERVAHRNDQQFMLFTSRRQLNSLSLMEKAVAFTNILKADAWLSSRIADVELHNVQLGIKFPGQEAPAANRVLFTVYATGVENGDENDSGVDKQQQFLTAAEARLVCRKFFGATLANIRSKPEADVLELSPNFLDIGVWVGLTLDPRSSENSSAFWWSDGLPLLKPTENAQELFYAPLFLPPGDESDGPLKANCVKLGSEMMLERTSCDVRLPAALCEMPFTKPWYSLILQNGETNRFDWKTASEECSSKSSLVDAEKILFRDDDLHLQPMIDPLAGSLAVPKSPALLSEALKVLSAWRLGEPCWIGLKQFQKLSSPNADESMSLFQWVDGSFVVDESEFDWSDGDWYHTNEEPSTAKDNNATTSNLHNRKEHNALPSDVAADSLCVAISVSSFSLAQTAFSRLRVKYSLFPCQTKIGCALCQASFPTHPGGS